MVQVQTRPLIALLAALLPPIAGTQRAGRSTAEDRALAYLSREVPQWFAQKKCFSCHNNGDAARALYTGMRLGYSLPRGTLINTERWLCHPQGWDHIDGDVNARDTGLARLQFASALLSAVEARAVSERLPLIRAAKFVAQRQQKDGCWKVDADAVVGSPVTYGTCLATYMAVRLLHNADARGYRVEIERAERWLAKAEVNNVPEAAAVLMAADDSSLAVLTSRKQADVAFLQRAESDQGWGPFVHSPPEPFDTAVALLALARQPRHSPVVGMIARGRAYLIGAQRPDGSWRETTRPAGADSYAERVSTTAWATLALLLTKRPPGTQAERATGGVGR
jgi:hypothetical protein